MKRILIIVFLIASLLISAKNIIILHTNDIRDVWDERGADFINPDFPPVLGGVYSFATAVKYERQKATKNGDILLIMDSGNFSAKYIVEDSIDMQKAINVFNYLKYDVINFGIDELYGGCKFIEKNIHKFNMPVLLSNIRFNNCNINTKEYIILNIDDIKIGIFGLTTEYAYFDLRNKVLKTVSIEREIEKARALVDILKTNKCDIIIGLTSIGFEHDIKLADTIEGIDLILGGYDGKGLREPIETPINHTIIMKGYGELSSYDKIVLKLDVLNNIIGYKGESITLFKDAFMQDGELKQLIRRLNDKNNKELY